MITHVSTSQFGGAGNAARRLHEGLLANRVDSRFVSAIGTANEARKLEVLARRYPRFWQRAARKIGYGLTAQEKWNNTADSLDCEGVFTTDIKSDSSLLQHTSITEASVINLHWVAGTLPWKEFFQTVRCPLIWTLHDMNPFLGIFHYETDRKRGGELSWAFDSRIREEKKRILKQNRPAVIVSPSKWLQDQSQNSELFGDIRHKHIPYGLNTNVFKPYSREFARSVFQLPTDRKLMLVVAERLDDHRKGFDLLLNAVQTPELAAEWDLVAVGDGELPFDSLKCHRVGVVQDERLMALVYAAADMTVITSREDNLPNVILESLCCGTPVIATPAGGMPEPIVPGRDGFIAESISVDAVSAILKKAISHQFDRPVIAQFAAQSYDHSVQANAYVKLYSSIMRSAGQRPKSL